MDVNAEQNKLMIMFREENAEHKHKREMVNQEFEDVSNFKYLGATLKTKITLFHRAFRFTEFYLYQRMHLFLSYTKIT